MWHRAGETMARLFSPRQPPSEDLFYETYYSLSQQYPLLLLLLLIVLLGLLALLPVAWASGRVSRGWRGALGQASLRTSGQALSPGHFQGWDSWVFFSMCFLCWTLLGAAVTLHKSQPLRPQFLGLCKETAGPSKLLFILFYFFSL